MTGFGGMSLAEFQATENIRAFLGHRTAIVITRWSPGTGAVITELPATSRVPVGSDLAALEGGLSH